MNIHQEIDADSGVQLVVLENETLRATVAPSIGGRVTSLVHLPNCREFLWRNPRLNSPLVLQDQLMTQTSTAAWMS